MHIRSFEAERVLSQRTAPLPPPPAQSNSSRRDPASVSEANRVCVCEREREREGEGGREAEQRLAWTTGLHDIERERAHWVAEEVRLEGGSSRTNHGHAIARVAHTACTAQCRAAVAHLASGEASERSTSDALACSSGRLPIARCFPTPSSAAANAQAHAPGRQGGREAGEPLATDGPRV